MSDFTTLEQLKAYARVCPTKSLEQYSKGIALIESGNMEEGQRVLKDLAFDYDEPAYDMPHFNDKLLDLLCKLS
jgi:DNA primase catalytic subunit